MNFKTNAPFIILCILPGYAFCMYYKYFLLIFLCMGGGWETSNPAKFLPFHFVK